MNSYLLDKIKDPIDDDETISFLIRKSTRNEYDSLIYHNNITKKDFDNALEYFNDFFVKYFNIWKQNILSATDEELRKFENRFEEELDFVELKRELENISISSHSDFMNLVKNSLDSQLYVCSGFVDNIPNFGWRFYLSDHITLGKNGIASKDVCHRLYVCSKPNKVYLFVQRFIEACIKENIPYNLKTISYMQGRDDNIVIYTNDKYIIYHIRLINETIAKSDDIEFYEPPILTGKLNEYIGYGSEPIEPGQSFNEKRVYFLNIARIEVNKFYEKNKNKYYMYEGKLLPLYKINEITRSFSDISDEVLEIISKETELINNVRNSIKRSLIENGISNNSCVDIACLNYKYSDDTPYKKNLNK